MKHSSRASLLTLAVLAALSASCGKSKSSTAPEPVTSRTVTLSLRDSSGAPIVGITVWTASQDGLTIFGGPTDAQGLRSVTMPVGPSIAAMVPDLGESISNTLVAGGTFTVPANSRPASDTIMVRLVAHTGSRITGIVHRAGSATDHSGVTVAVRDYLRPAFANSDVSGAYTLGRFPPGDWNVGYTDIVGTGTASQVVHIPVTPGTVTAPTITLTAPLPSGATLRARPIARRYVR